MIIPGLLFQCLQKTGPKFQVSFFDTNLALDKKHLGALEKIRMSVESWPHLLEMSTRDILKWCKAM